MDNEILHTYTSNKPPSKEAIEEMLNMARQIREQQEIKQQFHEKTEELQQAQTMEKLLQAQSDMLFYRWIMTDSTLSYRDKCTIIGSHWMKREAEANEKGLD